MRMSDHVNDDFGRRRFLPRRLQNHFILWLQTTDRETDKTDRGTHNINDLAATVSDPIQLTFACHIEDCHQLSLHTEILRTFFAITFIMNLHHLHLLRHRPRLRNPLCQVLRLLSGQVVHLWPSTHSTSSSALASSRPLASCFSARPPPSPQPHASCLVQLLEASGVVAYLGDLAEPWQVL